jgi:hypothetical protein
MQAKANTTPAKANTTPVAAAPVAPTTANALPTALAALLAQHLAGPKCAPKPVHIATSSVVRPVQLVHAVYASMPGATRAAVLAACAQLGIATATATTQYAAAAKAAKAAAASAKAAP